MVYGWFAGIAEQTLAASIVILAVLFIQYVLRRFINARVRYLLWLLVIARLLLPAVPDSPVSMLHILGNSKHLLTTILDKGPDTGASKGDYQELAPGEGDQVTYPANNTVRDTQGQTDTAWQKDGAAAVNRSSAQAVDYPLWLKIGTGIWLLGVMLMLLNGLLYIRRMHRERRRLRRVNAPEILKVVLATRRQFGIRRAIPIYTGGSANNPYLSGLLRPWIFVPEQALRELDASRLRHILAHELAHCKRRDMLWNLLGSLAATIHWFNPLMWLAIRRMKIDREVACDAYVLEVLGEEEAIDYGLTLVEFLKRFSRVRERRGHLYFSNPQQRQQIRRRISMIQSFKKRLLPHLRSSCNSGRSAQHRDAYRCLWGTR
ncbi:M56 family metallopeptidase [Paenibacillus rhizoplanae]|uniref:M56 family metallopeptidase n=1 Tax=Paenibacillus rhizoplanae TaxID=1917181 RepID=UPI00360985A7